MPGDVCHEEACDNGYPRRQSRRIEAKQAEEQYWLQHNFPTSELLREMVDGARDCNGLRHEDQGVVKSVGSVPSPTKTAVSRVADDVQVLDPAGRPDGNVSQLTAGCHLGKPHAVQSSRSQTKGNGCVGESPTRMDASIPVRLHRRCSSGEADPALRPPSAACSRGNPKTKACSIPLNNCLHSPEKRGIRTTLPRVTLVSTEEAFDDNDDDYCVSSPPSPVGVMPLSPGVDDDCADGSVTSLDPFSISSSVASHISRSHSLLLGSEDAGARRTPGVFNPTPVVWSDTDDDDGEDGLLKMPVLMSLKELQQQSVPYDHSPSATCEPQSPAIDSDAISIPESISFAATSPASSECRQKRSPSPDIQFIASPAKRVRQRPKPTAAQSTLQHNSVQPHRSRRMASRNASAVINAMVAPAAFPKGHSGASDTAIVTPANTTMYSRRDSCGSDCNWSNVSSPLQLPLPDCDMDFDGISDKGAESPVYEVLPQSRIRTPSSSSASFSSPSLLTPVVKLPRHTAFRGGASKSSSAPARRSSTGQTSCSSRGSRDVIAAAVSESRRPRRAARENARALMAVQNERNSLCVAPAFGCGPQHLSTTVKREEKNEEEMHSDDVANDNSSTASTRSVTPSERGDEKGAKGAKMSAIIRRLTTDLKEDEDNGLERWKPLETDQMYPLISRLNAQLSDEKSPSNLPSPASPKDSLGSFSDQELSRSSKVPQRQLYRSRSQGHIAVVSRLAHHCPSLPRTNGWKARTVCNIETEVHNERVRYSFRSLTHRKRETVTVGSNVLLSCGRKQQPYVAHLRQITQEQNKDITLLLSWYYRPGDVDADDDAVVSVNAAELFSSDHTDINLAHCLIGVCYVTSKDAYTLYRARRKRHTTGITEPPRSACVPQLRTSPAPPAKDLDTLAPITAPLNSVFFCTHTYDHSSGRLRQRRDINTRISLSASSRKRGSTSRSA